jgi:hypothetical protein
MKETTQGKGASRTAGTSGGGGIMQPFRTNKR